MLHGGGMVYAGDIASSIETYHKMVATNGTSRRRGPGFDRAAPASPGVTLESHEGSTIQQSDPVEVSTTLHIASEVAGFTLICVLDDMNQRRVFHLRRDSSEFKTRALWRGTYKISFKLPPLWLEPGLYTLYFKAVFQGEDRGHPSISRTSSIWMSAARVPAGTPS